MSNEFAFASNYLSSSVKSIGYSTDSRPIETYNSGLVRFFDYRGKLSESELVKITENYSVYKAAANQAGIPWQMVAAVHYRESSLLIRPRNHGGPFQFDPPLYAGEEEFGIGAEYAARTLQKKSGFRLYNDTVDECIIKDAFWGYNGRAYGSYDKSPYVMNGFDAAHSNMQIKGTQINEKTGERIRVDRIDENLGAYTFYIELKKAFDETRLRKLY